MTDAEYIAKRTKDCAIAKRQIKAMVKYLEKEPNAFKRFSRMWSVCHGIWYRLEDHRVAGGVRWQI